MHYHLVIQDKKYVVEIGAMKDGIVAVNVNDEVYHVSVENLDPLNPSRASAHYPKAAEAVPATPPPAAASVATAAAAVGNGAVKAPIPGLLIDLMVQVGDTVAIGQTVAIMEAMKMENNINSTVAGKVQEIRVERGAVLSDGDVIMVIR